VATVIFRHSFGMDLVCDISNVFMFLLLIGGMPSAIWVLLLFDITIVLVLFRGLLIGVVELVSRMCWFVMLLA
jgi:hypothetical protein